MQVIHSIREMQAWSENRRCEGRRIGLVPTMGYLHEGHLSLVRAAKEKSDCSVVSIFVNPTQFAPHEDFHAYPRDFDRDCRLLEKEKIDVAFRPAVEEIYPTGFQSHIEVAKLSAPLCGMFRSGHFRGVATIVAKLFNAVRPHVAIFGRKDYQQLQVIRRLVQDLNYDIEIEAHPIVREADGLAMSSRNAYLNPEERRAALGLSRSLGRAELLVRQGERRKAVIVDVVRKELEKEPLRKVEYVAFCDPTTLQELDRLDGAALLALAVRIGQTRLIDNVVLET
ncbi:MAG TPA: pantoate--beta-alanine ligase [Terriglobales bacterium]|nr:pantoate--beta-alanine ligase [Terriglobales bacterium]